MLLELKKKEKAKADIEPTEFKLFDSRFDVKTAKKDEFDGISQMDEGMSVVDEDEDTESQAEEVKQENIKVVKSGPIKVMEVDKPEAFRIADDRIDYVVENGESDRFSETELDESQESSAVGGIWEYAQKFEGDEKLNVLVETVVLVKEDKAVQVMSEEAKLEEMKRQDAKQNIKDLVDATISAWSSNPSMVKKQLDLQHAAMRMYKEQIEDLQYQLNLKKEEFEKRVGIDSIRSLEQKKKELERQNEGKNHKS